VRETYVRITQLIKTPPCFLQLCLSFAVTLAFAFADFFQFPDIHSSNILRPTAGFPLKLSRVGSGLSLDGTPHALNTTSVDFTVKFLLNSNQPLIICAVQEEENIYQ
jgi:hypothetical protein